MAREMNTSTTLEQQACAATNPVQTEAVAQEEFVSTARRRMCMAALMTAAILDALDTTIANTALPEIAVDLHSTEATIIWVTNAYQIAMIAALLPFAALGESMGYRRVFIGGLALFGLASAVCGSSATLAWLVAGRAMQGVGAAAIMSVIAAFIRH